jgi:hypothetical protein
MTDQLQQHIVKKLFLDLQLEKQKDAIPLQDNMVSVAEHSLISIMNDVFSEIPDIKEMIEIDKLELDLGSISTHNIVQEFTEKFGKKLRDELLKIEIGQTSAGNVKRALAEQSILKAFVYFLKKGIFPWWYESKQNVSILFEEILNGNLEPVISKIIQELSSQTSRKRFVQVIPDDQIIYFLTVSIASSPSIEKIFLKEMVQSTIPFFKSIAFDRARTIVWETILNYYIAHDFSATKETDLSLIIIACKEDKKIFTPEAIKEILRNPEKKESLQDLRKKTYLKILKEETDRPLSKDQVEEKTYSEAELLKGEEIYVTNAGLVLCWPYLTTFFRAFNLLSENDFLDESARNKALYLLQQLASSEENAEEQELFLNKILCGWNLEEVPSPVILNTEEKEEADALLTAVVEHWKVLKNTSPEGLREAFIRRSGILTYKEFQGWHLKVERIGVDALIGAIPWGFSIVRLPWMPEPLEVDW